MPKKRDEWFGKLMKFKGTIAFIIIIITATVAFNATYATNDRVDLLAMRLEQKIVNDDLNNIQERIWKLEDRYICYGQEECVESMPQTVWEEYRELWVNKEKLEKQFNMKEEK